MRLLRVHWFVIDAQTLLPALSFSSHCLLIIHFIICCYLIRPSPTFRLKVSLIKNNSVLEKHFRADVCLFPPHFVYLQLIFYFVRVCEFNLLFHTWLFVPGADFSNMLQTMMELFRHEFLTLTQSGECFLFLRNNFWRVCLGKRSCFLFRPCCCFLSFQQEGIPSSACYPPYILTHTHTLTGAGFTLL